MIETAANLTRRTLGALLNSQHAVGLMSSRCIVSDEGTAMDPQVQALASIPGATHLNPSLFPAWTRTPMVRMIVNTSLRVSSPRAPRPGNASDWTIHLPDRKLRMRCYHPGITTDRPLPMVLFIHGGGFVCGSLDAYDAVCGIISQDAQCIVAAVEYRLAPEHPYPAAVNDCSAALQWLGNNGDNLGGDPARVALVGDSAGGSLAAVTALRCCESDWSGPRPLCQVLGYPVVDQTRSHASHQTFADDPFLPKQLIDYFQQCYVGPADDLRHPWISPLFAEDVAAVAPAVIYTAGFDPLRDEGRAYAERLRQEGVPVIHRELSDQPHGFLSMSGIVSRARQELDDMTSRLRVSLRGDPRQGL